MANIVLPGVNKLSQLGPNSAMLVEQDGSIYRHDTDYIVVDIIYDAATDSLNCTHTLEEINEIVNTGKTPIVTVNHQAILTPVLDDKTLKIKFFQWVYITDNVSMFYNFTFEGKKVYLALNYENSGKVYRSFKEEAVWHEYNGKYYTLLPDWQMTDFDTIYWSNKCHDVKYFNESYGAILTVQGFIYDEQNQLYGYKLAAINEYGKLIADLWNNGWICSWVVAD